MSRPVAPGWGDQHPAFRLAARLALALGVGWAMCGGLAPAAAQPKGKPADKAAPGPAAGGDKAGGDKAGGDKAGDKKGPVKTLDFTGLDLSGRMRSPQLLYFLERANEELERASLEKRSFIPHMVRSLDEEAL